MLCLKKHYVNVFLIDFYVPDHFKNIQNIFLKEIIFNLNILLNITKT
jgi:hypothetical protein